MEGVKGAELKRRVEEALGMVQLEAQAARKPQQLSGGQHQRVALARALAPEPEVLLLDEPLSALDLKLRKEMQVELKRLQLELGITFIFVTHDQEEALTMSDRIGVMSAGHLLQVGPPREIYNRPVNRFVADFIGETNFIPASIEGGVATVAGGARLAVATDAPTGDHTIAVRPEHVRIGAEGDGALPATVGPSVYFGTDSHVHLTLDDGTAIVARQQSDATGSGTPAEGSRVGVSFADGAVQVLED